MQLQSIISSSHQITVTNLAPAQEHSKSTVTRTWEEGAGEHKWAVPIRAMDPVAPAFRARSGTPVQPALLQPPSFTPSLWAMDLGDHRCSPGHACSSTHTHGRSCTLQMYDIADVGCQPGSLCSLGMAATKQCMPAGPGTFIPLLKGVWLWSHLMQTRTTKAP